MANAKSTRVFDRAVALIQDYDGEALQWLFVGSDRDDAMELLWTDRLERESYRESISREIDWRFDLDRKRDYIVCSTPRLSLILDSTGERLITREEALESGFGVVEIYPVQLYGKRSRKQLREDDQVAFLHVGRDRRQDIQESLTSQTRLLLRTIWAESE